MNNTQRLKQLTRLLIVALLCLQFTGTEIAVQLKKQKEVKMDFKIFSASFKDGEPLSAEYGYYKDNVSPPLNWINPPSGTKSFVLLVDDPDAPIGDWVHWIVLNIPAGTFELKENASGKKLLPKGSFEGLNDFKKNNYGGPCPPSGTHRYFFKLYALDANLQLKESTTKKLLLETVKGHVLAQVSLMGTYKSVN
jgi:Raf kinase inhibitor-like YbhB/YbcL family protein